MKNKDIYSSINPELIEWLEPIVKNIVPSHKIEMIIDLVERVKFLLFVKSTIDIKTGCINYRGKSFAKGYPLFNFGSFTRGIYIHHLSFLLHNKQRRDSKLILHSCDNRSCINNDHFRLDTHAENMKDKRGKKILTHRMTNSKESKRIKMQILVQYYGMRMHNRSLLSKKFNVSYARILQIINSNRDFVYDPKIHDKYLIGGKDESNHN